MINADSTYRELAASLRERLEVIADREHFRDDPDGHLERLKAASARIEAIQKQLPPRIDPRLAHFLHSCSYDKALAFLDDDSR